MIKIPSIPYNTIAMASVDSCVQSFLGVGKPQLSTARIPILFQNPSGGSTFHHLL